VAYGSTQLSDGTRKVGGTPEDMRMPRGQFITPYGQLSPIGYYAMVAQLHMQRYGTTHKDLAEVAVAARKWAQLNPKAYRREDTSIEEVMASKMIADPLRQRDCCLVTDAGGAVIVTSAARARTLKRPPVYVMGIAESFSHHYTPFNTVDWLDTNVKQTADAALAMAGVTRADIDVVQIYDHFTIGVIQSLEELGFCKRGEGGAFVADGRLAPGGDFPINTSGGGLSYNHPGQFGMLLLLEAVHQLRKECGERQLPKAELALVHAPGLVFSCNTTLILGV
jgi:acetyl-CoA acetyltransferase